MKSIRSLPYLLLFLCCILTGAHAAPNWPQLTLSAPISGFNFPTHITHAGDGSGRIFVTEVGGRIRISKNGGVLATPFLDISSRQSQGLFSVAFPPDYAQTGYFYVNYIDGDKDVRISRFQVTANADIADADSEQVVIKVPSPWADSIYATAGHAGGELGFSPNDGYLYVGIGDGDPGNRDSETSEGDLYNLAQNPQSLRGKMLRLDVSGDDFSADANRNYRIPADNPFVNTAGYLPEIWALGVRNPWRSSFDRQTGDFYIGDVGQDLYEEVDFQPGSSAGGENYGWKIMEGEHCYRPASGCDQTGLTLPVVEYPHDTNQLGSVTGGRVYRGLSYPRMKGIYFYGDYNFGHIWGLVRENGVWHNQLLVNTAIPAYGMISFGEDEAGNVWVTNANNGTIYKLTDSVLNTAPVAAGQTITANAGTATDITLTATDSEGDTLTYSIVTPPAHGTLGGTAPNLTYTPDANYSGPDSFTFQASDGEHNSDAATISVTVNALPTISDISDRSTPQGVSTGAIPFTIGDAETAANDLTLTKASSNTTLVPTANITFGGSGENRTVTVTPAAAQSGTATITISVTDANGASRSDSFVLTVTAPTYTVSGRVANAQGMAISGVSVSRGEGSTPVSTNSAGYYTFFNVPTGTHTLTPGLNNYTFAPASRSVTVTNANIGNQNFIGTTGYSISGRISNSAGVAISGASVSRGAGSTPVTTNSAGYYTFIGVQPGNYTLTASKAGTRFTPPSRAVSITNDNISGLNFIGATGYNISGRIASSSGIGQAGISVKRSGSNVAVATNSAGYYTFTDVPNGSVIVTPTGTGLSFTPESRTVTVNNADTSGHNFIAQSGYSISGRITTSAAIGIAGVVVSRTGSTTTAVTNSAGYFTFNGVANGTYTLTPSKSGNTFTPTTKSVTVSGANVSGQNFLGAEQ